MKRLKKSNDYQFALRFHEFPILERLAPLFAGFSKELDSFILKEKKKRKLAYKASAAIVAASLLAVYIATTALAVSEVRAAVIGSISVFVVLGVTINTVLNIQDMERMATPLEETGRCTDLLKTVEKSENAKRYVTEVVLIRPLYLFDFKMATYLGLLDEEEARTSTAKQLNHEACIALHSASRAAANGS